MLGTNYYYHMTTIYFLLLQTHYSDNIVESRKKDKSSLLTHDNLLIRATNYSDNIVESRKKEERRQQKENKAFIPGA